MAIRVLYLDAQLGSSTYPAKEMRRLTQHIFSVDGVIKTDQFLDPLKVQQKATPNMSVDVLGGDSVIKGAFTTDWGRAVVFSDATVNLALAASDPTNPRIDIVVMRIYDDGTQANSKGVLEVVTGTPAASPTVPSTPANSYNLAEIAVGAGVTTITNANITNKRTWLSPIASGGWTPAIETWTYASPTTFTVNGNVTDSLQVGDKIKLTQTTVKYFYVAAISYASPTTTVTVCGGTSYNLAAAAISNAFYSKSNPQDFPDWFAYTPEVTADTTPPTITNKNGWFKVSGKTLYCMLETGPITANGSGMYYWSIPTGFIINTGYSKISTIVDPSDSAMTLKMPVGIATVGHYGDLWQLVGREGFHVFVASSSTVALAAAGSSNRANGLGSLDGFAAVVPYTNLNFSVPIL